MRRAIFLAIVLVLMAGSAEAGTVNVNTTGWWNESGIFNAASTPIQAALNNASAGDYISVVETAEYPESLTWTQDGLTLDLNGAVLNGTGETSKDAVTIAHDGAILKNGYFKGFRHGIFLNGEVSDCFIQGVAIENCVNTGIYLPDYGATLTNLTILDTVITNPGNNGFFSNNNVVQDVSINNLIVNDFMHRGLYLNPKSGSSSLDLDISNSIFVGAPGTYSCLEIYPRGGTLTLENNTLLGSNAYGLQVQGSDAPVVLIEDNTIENNANGLYLQGVSNLNLSSNLIEDNGGEVFHLQSVNNVTVGDVFLDDSVKAYNRAVYVGDSDTISIFNLTSLNASEHSIYLAGTVSNIAFRDVTIENCGRTGIYLPDYGATLTNLTILDTVITNPGNNGFFSNNNVVQDVSIDDLIVNGFMHRGLFLNPKSGSSSLDLDISNSMFAGAPGTYSCLEIYPRGGTLTLENNTLLESNAYGL